MDSEGMKILLTQLGAVSGLLFTVFVIALVIAWLLLPFLLLLKLGRIERVLRAFYALESKQRERRIPTKRQARGLPDGIVIGP